MWARGYRDEVWSRLDQAWDLVIIGGGITGAGILGEAVRHGKKALLVEAQDFSSGTSSRSTKLVHGGLRYLRQGQFLVTRKSVKERERLMEEGAGLVNALGNLGGFFGPYMVGYVQTRPGDYTYAFALLSGGLILAACVALTLRKPAPEAAAPAAAARA